MTFNEYVANILTEKAKDYDSGKVSDVLGDLIEHGCQSGMIGELVYTHQTTPIFIQFQRELNKVMASIINDSGFNPFESHQLWDKEDPLVLGDINRQLVVWMAFEQVASQ